MEDHHRVKMHIDVDAKSSNQRRCGPMPCLRLRRRMETSPQVWTRPEPDPRKPRRRLSADSRPGGPHRRDPRRTGLRGDVVVGAGGGRHREPGEGCGKAASTWAWRGGHRPSHPRVRSQAAGLALERLGYDPELNEPALRARSLREATDPTTSSATPPSTGWSWCCGHLMTG